MDLFQKFNEVLASFERHKVEYILIGGYAIILYGFPRLTQDIDVIIRMEKKNIQRLRTALGAVFNDPAVEDITFEELNKYAVIRFGTESGFYIDIMAGIGSVANYDSIAYKKLDIDGGYVRIATPEALYKLKKNTVRPQDKTDAYFLKQLLEERKNNAG